MKIKVRPEDFQVEEVQNSNIQRDPADYRVYKLEKSGIGNFELVSRLSEELQIPRTAISYSGIKDRYGKTSQLIAIQNSAKLPKQLSGRGYTLTHAGFSKKPLSSEEILGNRFTITLRDISPDEENRIDLNIEKIKQYGIPNYYDDQRFGSIRHRQGFMGKELFLGHKEEALKLFMTPSEFDHSLEKNFKETIIANWGNWKKCLDEVPNHPEIHGNLKEIVSIVRFLSQDRREKAFSQALEKIDKNLLILIASAYRSFLFNEILSHYLTFLNKEKTMNLFEIPYLAGTLIFYDILPEDILTCLREQLLPEPAYDSVIKNASISKILDEILEREKIALSDLKVRQIYGVTVHGKERKMLLFPEDWMIETPVKDELYPKQKKQTIRFFLPRGSYATVVIKRLSL